MREYDVEDASGRTADLDAHATTMSFASDAQCSKGHTPLLQSSRCIFCNECGLWWWSDRAWYPVGVRR